MLDENIYIVPNFEPSELINYFSSKGIHISPLEIDKPTGKSVLRIYHAILCYIKGNEDYIEDDGRYLFILFKRMDDFLKQLGITFFELRDLQFPAYNRNLNILSTIYNFCIFKESKEETIQSIKEEKDDQLRRLDSLKSEVLENKSKILKILNDEKLLKIETENIKAEIETLEVQVKSIFKDQRDKINQIDTLKKEKEDIKTILSNKNLEILNLNQEIQEMRSQIIDDPQKMILLIEEMEKLVKDGQNETLALKSKLNEKREQIVQFDKNIITLQNRIKNAVITQEKMSAVNNLRSELKKFEEENMNLNSEILFEKKRSNSHSKQISHIEMKIENIKNKEKENTAEMTQKLSELKNQLEEVKKERKAQFDRIELNQKEIKEYEYETAQMCNKHQKNVYGLLCSLSELKEEIKSKVANIEDFVNETGY
ncbi:Centromere-associated protein NUF2 [Pseudoloma neurophilia]|uniref:Centromere-associated protein NUF2 n=1 Tax=Pseudoloma neurophilia TaxID=146866 RepID=A0A0R0M3K9_9MICR|nr:Centromere-associated protein NUF2 [Pseudoloma neurophilia]